MTLYAVSPTTPLQRKLDLIFADLFSLFNTGCRAVRLRPKRAYCCSSNEADEGVAANLAAKILCFPVGRLGSIGDDSMINWEVRRFSGTDSRVWKVPASSSSAGAFGFLIS